MKKNVTCYNFVISCPSDIKSEVKIVEKTVSNFNGQMGSSLNIRIDTKHYKKSTYPASGAEAQELINRQMLEDADAVIAIFGNKLGTKTSNYDSGTIEEIEEMIKKGRNVFVYFSNKLVRKSSVDPDEEVRLRSFKNAYKGLYYEYASNADFESALYKHLELFFIDLTQKRTQEKRPAGNDGYWQTAEKGEPFFILEHYLPFQDIKPIVSYASYNAADIVADKQKFTVKIDASGCPGFNKRDFVMALIEYVPCEDWSAFWDAGYALSIEMRDVKNILAVQLEIKDENRRKFVDRKLNLSNGPEIFRLPLQRLTPRPDAWRGIGEICFTVFLNPQYMEKWQGEFTACSVQLIPYQE